MAIAQIQKFLLITQKENIDETLKHLQNLSIVQIEPLANHVQETDEKIAEIDEEIYKTRTALGILTKYSAKKPKNDHEPPKNLAETIIETHQKIEQLKENILKTQHEISEILPYISFKGALTPTKTQSTVSTLGYINGIHTKEEIEEMFRDVYVEIINSEQNKTYLRILYPKTLPHITEFTALKTSSPLSPAAYINALKSDIQYNKTLILRYVENLSRLSNYIEHLTDTHLLKKKELAEEKHKLLTTQDTAAIGGYILTKNKSALEKEFKNAYIEFSEANENSPVAFSNNAFVSPVENITESYTMPSKNDIDPNPIMSFFYYLFFGMMFSDAGYGLLLIVVCGYLGFLTNSKTKKMMRMFFFCGVSTLFWGLMYGSFFGNAITSIGETFLERKLILRPLWINPTSEPLTLLIFSIALGFIQILVGLGIKMFMSIKQGFVKDGIYDTGSWIITLAGLGITSAGIVYPFLLKPGIIITISGTLMLIATQGRAKKNLILKLTGGVLSLYNITSYISDILSYSRLMALGLATGVIAQVVNILGALGGNSLAGKVMFAAVFLIGHGLNFAINMLGAYVHTNRLQYVEFYSKFYEGGGRAFVPFGRRYN